MSSSDIKTICGTPVCDDEKEGLVINPTSNTLGKEYVGTSETDKPMNVQQYSIYHELDTGKNYYYDNGEWNEIPCCSGGGSSDFSTAKVDVSTTPGQSFDWSFPVAVASDDEEGIVTVLVTQLRTGLYEVVLYK